RDAKAAPEQLLRRGRSERDDQLGPDHGELGLEPRAARGQLARVGLLVQPSLAAGLPFEVLHGIGDVDLVAIDTGGHQRLVQEPSRRPDERVALPVLLIAGLLTDEHDARVTRPLAEHGLRRASIEVAAGTPGGLLPEHLQAWRHWSECRPALFSGHLPRLWADTRYGSAGRRDDGQRRSVRRVRASGCVAHP